MSPLTPQYEDGLRNLSPEENPSYRPDHMRALSKSELNAIFLAQASGMQNAYRPIYEPTNPSPPPRATGVFASLKRFLNSLGARAGRKTISRERSSSFPNESTNGGK